MFFTIYSELCHKMGKSPSWVAQQNGISKATVTYWRNNPNTQPSTETLHKLADFFGVSIDYLTGKESPEIPKVDSVHYAAYKELETESEDFAEDVLAYIRFKKSQKQRKD